MLSGREGEKARKRGQEADHGGERKEVGLQMTLKKMPLQRLGRLAVVPRLCCSFPPLVTQEPSVGAARGLNQGLSECQTHAMKLPSISMSPAAFSKRVSHMKVFDISFQLQGFALAIKLAWLLCPQTAGLRAEVQHFYY